MNKLTELAPSAPQRVTVELFDGVNVRLAWQAPEQYPQFVTSFLVYYRPASSSNASAVVSIVLLLRSLVMDTVVR